MATHSVSTAATNLDVYRHGRPPTGSVVTAALVASLMTASPSVAQARRDGEATSIHGLRDDCYRDAKNRWSAFRGKPARTELGRKLMARRLAFLASNPPLLTVEQINEEVAKHRERLA